VQQPPPPAPSPPQVIALCEKPRNPPLRHIIVDTPGQIEIFTWSASGAIITELFASGFPTVVAYVVDTPRCVRVCVGGGGGGRGHGGQGGQRLQVHGAAVREQLHGPWQDVPPV
jgi:hypothetical protein